MISKNTKSNSLSSITKIRHLIKTKNLVPKKKYIFQVKIVHLIWMEPLIRLEPWKGFYFGKKFDIDVSASFSFWPTLLSLWMRHNASHPLHFQF